MDFYVEKFKNNITIPLMERMRKEHFSYLPNKLKKSVFTQTIKLSRELPIFYTSEDITNRFEIGMNAIVKELPSFLNEPELDKIYYEWLCGLETCITVHRTQKNEGPFKSYCAVCELLGISETTMSNFYEAGARLFKKHEYENAANAFYVLTILDYRRYNVWLSFGLSEQQDGKIEAALYGYSMASVNAENSPFPYIYSAECCLKMGQIEEANKYLLLAEETLNNNHHESKIHLEEYISKIRNQIVER